MSSKFTGFADHQRPLIDKQLQLIFEQQRSAARAQNEVYFDLIKQLGVLVDRGGKRLRPLLCLLAYEAYGGRAESVMQVAASQELLHAFFLIHDDIIDRDYHRWGDRNILGVYFEHYSKTMQPRDALHAAEAQALLAGDACLTMANQALISSEFDAQQLLAAQHMQQAVILTEIGGEAADTAYPYAGEFPTEAQVLQMYRDKTANYSLSLPLRLGALLAGAKGVEFGYLINFSNAYGVAYQLQDDLLGMFGDERQTGKPTLSDLREGKCTILVLKTIELASPAQRKTFLGLLGSGDATATSLQRAQTIMIDTGARAYVDGLIDGYTKAALDCLALTAMDQIGKERLTDLVALLANRQH